MKKIFGAIIQARMGSMRAPGKVLTSLAGSPMIAHIINRLKASKLLDKIILAIPDNDQNKPLEKWAQNNKIDFVRGSEEDVLQRYIFAAETFGIDQILRVCADSPLIDLKYVEDLIETHKNNGADFTTISEIVPIGTTLPAASLEALKKIRDSNNEKPHREHVVTFIEAFPEKFKLGYLSGPPYLKDKHFRLTVDTKEDIKLLEIIYNQFCTLQNPIVNLEEVIKFLDERPEIAEINSKIQQKSWRLK